MEIEFQLMVGCTLCPGSPLALYFPSLDGTRVLYKQTEDNQDVKHNPAGRGVGIGMGSRRVSGGCGRALRLVVIQNQTKR